jgi:uncharacterized protein (TIGR01777 family)
MRILITGATGLIGTRLTELLLQNNISVHYLTTSTEKLKSEHDRIGFFWNPAAGIIDENCLMGVDAIVHLAGSSVAKRWTPDYRQEILESRLLSANLLYKAVKNYPNQVRKIVSASAIGIYKESTSEPLTETETEMDTTFLAGVVERWEQSVDKFSRLGMEVVKLRTGLVLSQNGGVLPQLIKPVRLGVGAAFGSGRQIQSWIHIDDLARMFFYAVNNWQGVYNAVALNPVTQKSLVKEIARRLKKPLLMPGIPRLIMSLVLGEMHQMLYASQNVSSSKAIQSGFDFKFPTIDLALDDLLKKK